MKGRIVIAIVCAAVLVPVLAHAQELTSLLTAVETIVRRLIPLAAGLALLAFFWGIARFIFAAGNEEARKEGRQFMVWSVVALFVLTSIWGIVFFLRDSLDLSRQKNIAPPSINF